MVALFDNAENLSKWMKGLQSFEHLSGTPGQAGAKSKLVFQMGKRRMEMIETITASNLPEEFSGTYETNGVIDTVKNKFVPIPGNKTKYVTEHEFKLAGFMKIIAWLAPGMFKKQSMKYLEDFKNFAEAN